MSTIVARKDEIWQQLRAHHQTLQDFGVRRCGLFGSFQRGEATEQSDIDWLVVFDPELKTFRNFMDLCFFLLFLAQLASPRLSVRGTSLGMLLGYPLKFGIGLNLDFLGKASETDRSFFRCKNPKPHDDTSSNKPLSS